MSHKITKKQAIQESIKLWGLIVKEGATSKYKILRKYDDLNHISEYESSCPACEYINGDILCIKSPIWIYPKTCLQNVISFADKNKNGAINILIDCIKAAQRNHIAYRHLIDLETLNKILKTQ